MEKSFKNKNILVIVFEIIVIASGIVGITFAASKIINNKSLTTITTGEYNLEYIGDNLITANNLEPISDNLVTYNTKDNVVRVEFSLRGVKENSEDDLIYDVMLDKMNIDCPLLGKYTKWRLYKNGNVLSSGSLDPAWDGSVLTDNMRLTDIQEDLPKYNEEYDKYVLLFWISESCDNLETCTLVDQSNIQNSTMSMEVFIAIYGGEKQAFERIPNYDTSCANKPILSDMMVPITYKNGTWQVADITNSDKSNLWYDYNNGIWANAALVKNNKYLTKGLILDEKDILGYYVWIPRYRYKLWNVTDTITDSYNAYEEGIDIIFENGLRTIKQENLENNKYLTHPAFGDNLKGFWISKYEISKIEDEYYFIPGKESYRNDTVTNYQSIIDNLNETYNLGKEQKISIINNLEWGATLYLSHSKYGVCKNDGCISISTNNCYVGGTNKQDTTTRNVYGVYDMAGASSEYAVENKDIGSATKEVILSNQDTWYEGHGMLSDRDYLIRGGIDHGLYYFGDYSMGSADPSTRSVIINTK